MELVLFLINWILVEYTDYYSHWKEQFKKMLQIYTKLYQSQNKREQFTNFLIWQTFPHLNAAITEHTNS